MIELILMIGKYVELNFRYFRMGNRRCLLCYSFVLLDCNYLNMKEIRLKYFYVFIDGCIFRFDGYFRNMSLL